MKLYESRAFYLLTYDMSNNKRRLKLAKLLESVGLRVQGSVFEGWLTDEELKLVRREGKKLIKPEEDSLWIYPICRACQDKMILIGQGKAAQEPGLVIL